MRLALVCSLAAATVSIAGCVCAVVGGDQCRDARKAEAEDEPTRDYRYDIVADRSCGDSLVMRVADGNGAASHAEVPANLFDYLELHAKKPQRFADAPVLSLWLRGGGDETYYGYVVELRAGVRTVPHVECFGTKPVVASVEYLDKKARR